jgi:hypothetical protein
MLAQTIIKRDLRRTNKLTIIDGRRRPVPKAALQDETDCTLLKVWSYLHPNKLKKRKRAPAKRMAPRKMHTGKVRTQARMIFRTVPF